MNSIRNTAITIAVAAATLLPATSASAVNYDSLEQFRLAGIQGDSASGAGLLAEDLDGDGNVDLLSAASDQLQFLRGDGRGHFEPAADDAVTAGKRIEEFRDAEPADLNGDEHVDLLALGGFFGDEVRPLIGNGDGTFEAGDKVAVADEGDALGVGDLDGDGDDDAVVGGFASAQTFLSDGAGSLSAGASFEMPGNCCDAVAVGRANGDALADIVATDPFAGIVVMLGDGAGGFTQQPPLEFVDANGPNLTSLVLTDVTGDARTDAVVLEADDRRPMLHVLRGDGLGAFTPSAPIALPYRAGGGPDALELADADGNGTLDAVVGLADIPSSAITVMPGDGAGGFGPGTAFAAHGSLEAVALADFDEDGHTDLAGSGYNERHYVGSMLYADGTVECDGERATFVGQEPGEVSQSKGPVRASESPYGSDADDVFSTGAGKDFVWGASGNDRLCAGASSDRLGGMKGDDVLVGGPGPDVLNGGSGKDVCIGGSGEDKLRNCETER